MKDTKRKLIIKDGNFAIYKTEKSILGGYYSVVDFKNKMAKSALCLDGAHDIFKQLILERENQKTNN